MRTSRTLKFSLILIFGCLVIDCSRESKPAAKPQLRVYNWPDFIGSKTLAEFEKRSNAKVIYETYSSNEELYSKLKASPGSHDVILPSTYMVQKLIREGMLQPIDKGKISNFSHISKRFLNLSLDSGNQFSAPYLWGTTGLGVNVEKAQEKGDDWGILFQRRYKGRISMLDSMRFSLGIALKRLGFSINSMDTQELQKAKQLLIDQKPLVKAYTETYVDLLASGEVWVSYCYSGDTYQLSKKNQAIRYSVPIQGSIIGMDSMCIPKGAQNAGLAHTFINYLLEPKVAAEISSELLYATPNEGAHAYIDKAILGDPAIYPSEEVLRKSEFLQDVGEATSLYEKAWEEVRGY